jgi:Na+-transporting methylmalonyl-CoA/oxaloacetate decarboxylase gamma subunit
MANPIIQALEITGLGMGLVFLGILVLWAMMALLVRIFRDKEETKPEAEPVAESKPDFKQKATAAAVAVALGKNDFRLQAAAIAVSTAIAFATHPAAAEKPFALASAWQIVNRMNQINLRNQAFTRKSRGN